MFKRANKVTALLVAAASVMSVVPAMAADSARLGTKDGTLHSAVAYKDGKYVYEGYRSDSDDEGVYYNNGEKDKLLEDVEDSDAVASYEDKYATAYEVSGSDDQYLVDLSNGTVSDDDTAEDRKDNATTKIRSTLKKTDRYGDITTNGNDIALSYVANNMKMGETWYRYAVTPVSDADGINNTIDGKLYGFTSSNGKYIDASNVANIYAFSSKKGKMVKIEEFTTEGKVKDDLDSDTGLAVYMTEAPVVLAQDKDNLYVKVEVNVVDKNEANTAMQTGTTTSAAATTAMHDQGLSNAIVTARTYIQKISKAQGEKKDEAYTPKSVNSYEVANMTTDEFKSTAAEDGRDAINDGARFTVNDGKLISVYQDGDDLKAVSLDFKKDKVKYDVAAPTGSYDLADDKVDVYFVEKDDSDSVSVDSGHGYDFDFDVDGNLWTVSDGKIYKFAKNEFTKVYTCDTALDSINVYDENNMITWEYDGDVYTTVNEGKAETQTEAPAPTPAKVGWDQLADGTWNFYDATGTKVAKNWVNVGGTWYYLKADGVMATGWLNDNGTWYYLAASGAMKTGWLNDNGTWYYLAGSGAMLANTTVDGYVLGASGAWIK